MDRERAAPAIAFIIVAGLVIFTIFGGKDRPLCAERDAPMAERLFASCIKALAGNHGPAAYECRQQADELSCKTWSRP